MYQPKRIYISGALMAAKDLPAARAKYEECALMLRAAGLDPYLPHRHTDPEGTPEIDDVDVYSRDVHRLLESDAVVAFLDEPSHGVGAELAISVDRGIPIVGLLSHGASISRFISGMLKASGRSVVMQFRDVRELKEVVPQHIVRLLASGNGFTPVLSRRLPS